MTSTFILNSLKILIRVPRHSKTYISNTFNFANIISVLLFLPVRSTFRLANQLVAWQISSANGFSSESDIAKPLSGFFPHSSN